MTTGGEQARTGLVAADPSSLFSADTIADPYPFYRALRDRTPLVGGPDNDVWMLMRYDDVYQALVDHQSFSSVQPGGGSVFTETPMVFDDEPRHAKLRRLVNKAFTPSRVAGLEPQIRQAAESLLDEMGEGEIEVIESLCYVMPLYVICDMLAVPRSDYRRFRQWSVDRSYVVGTSGAIGADPESLRSAQAGSQALHDYFRDLEGERRANSRDDLVSALVWADLDGKQLEDWEVAGMCSLFLTAGNVTVTNLLGNMLGLLAIRPELYQRLRSNRSLVPMLVEETLRFESPLQRFPRRTTREVEIGGVALPADAQVVVCFGAANRDPSVFEDADVFDVDRAMTKTHLTFSFGIHHCLGAPLARLEGDVVMQCILDRYERIEPSSSTAVRQRHEGTHLGYSHLPLVFHRG